MTPAEHSSRISPNPPWARDEGFEPMGWVRGGHLETVVPFLWPTAPVAGSHEERIVRVATNAAVGLKIAWPSGATRGTLLLVHGLAGSAESIYVCRMANRALEAGWVAVRMNCRTCGGTERLSETLYHQGQSRDIGRVLEELRRWEFPGPFAAMGFSLGGNLVLHYAGTAGRDCLAGAVVGINPPVDLDACSRVLERPGNRLYGLYFTRSLCQAIRRIRRVRQVEGPRALWWKIRTIRNFDRFFVVPDGGYASLEDYYETASAGPCLAGLRVPTLILSSGNDPLIPVKLFEAYHGTNREMLRFVHPERGGHLGYWQKGQPRFRAATLTLGFLEEKTRS